MRRLSSYVGAQISRTMASQRFKQPPLDDLAASKREVRAQFGALCYRMSDGDVEVLLITSRRTKRWIIPKGWPMPAITPAEGAAQEAWEEAGVRGKPSNQSIGVYSYNKEMEDGPDLPCAVMVYPLLVKSLEDVFPEAKVRERRWFSLKKAAAAVLEPELTHLIRDFDPRKLS